MLGLVFGLGLGLGLGLVLGLDLGLGLFENILIPMHKYGVGVAKYCQRNRRTITYHFRGARLGG